MTGLTKLLRDVEPFSSLTTEELAELERIGTPVRASAGEPICKAEAPLAGACILVSGSVTEARSDCPITHHRPGSILAAGALLSDRPNDHALTAETDVEAVLLPKPAFERLCLNRHPLGRAVLLQLVEHLVGRVRALNRTLNELLT